MAELENAMKSDLHNLYKDLGDLCDKPDHEYDPLRGSWMPPDPGFDWPLAVILAIGCILAIFLLVWI